MLLAIVRTRLALALLTLLIAASTTGSLRGDVAAPTTPPAPLQRGWDFLRPQLFAARSAPPHPAIVRVIAEERNGMSNGSGTLIDVRGEYGLIVTNWHVIRDATGEITVVFPDGFRSPARVQKSDRDWDLAALVILRPQATPLKIAYQAPQIGEPLTIAGYGKGNFRAQTGRCVQYVSPGSKHPYEMVEVSVQARQGDSGGPILNQAGEIAGVLFGAGSGSTSGSYCGRVRWFLESVWPNIGAVDSPPAPPKLPLDTTPGNLVSLGSSLGSRTNTPDVTAPNLVDIESPSIKTDIDFVDRVNGLESNSPSRRMIPYYSAPPDRDGPLPAEPRKTGSSRSYSLADFVGDTPIEQGKLLLAILGIMAIFSRLTAGLSSE